MLFEKKSLDYYKDLTTGGNVQLHLTQNEACTVLKAYDYGFDELDAEEKLIMNSVIGKLKDVIWP